MWDLFGCIIFLCLFLYYIRGNAHNPKAPPGPTPWPIVGNLFHIARASNKVALAFSELSKVYGEIFSVRMGTKNTVIITSREAMESILTNELAFGRDRTGTFSERSFGENIGLVFCDGKIWEKTRPWVFKTLKEYGFEKTSEMELYVHNATEDLFNAIEEQMRRNQIVKVELLHSLPIFSIIWKLMVQRLSEDDKKEIKIISEKSEKWIRSSFMWAGFLNAFPIISSFLPHMQSIQTEFFNASHKISKKLYLETLALLEKENRTRENPHTFVEALVQKSFTDADIFNLQHFQLVFEDIILTSAETSSSFMEYVVLFLILYPESQEKIYEEIKLVSRNGEHLSYADRKKMVYTQAFILEVHRNARIGQNFVPRKALGEIFYKDYVIKKGTIIITDTHLYNTDEKLWKDAQKFKPERFISDKGELIHASDIISFSFGKRNCPGELYSNVLTFLILTKLVQRYTISLPNGQPTPTTDLRPGIIFKPYPYQACYTKRNN